MWLLLENLILTGNHRKVSKTPASKFSAKHYGENCERVDIVKEWGWDWSKPCDQKYQVQRNHNEVHNVIKRWTILPSCINNST